MGRGAATAAGVAGAGQAIASPLELARAGGEAPSVLPHWQDPAAPWLCIEHRADSGARVRLDLRRIGFEVHWPREVLRIRGRDDVLRPFFPGYMFALPAHPRASWHAVKERGQFGIFVVGLKELGRPAHPPRGFVLGLINRAGGALDGVIPAKEDEIASLSVGDAVRITAGAFAGLPAVFRAERGKRVEVLLDILGTPRAVRLPAAAVRKEGDMSDA